MYRSAFGEFESEKMEAFYLERLRQMTVEERWRMVAGLRQIMVESVRDRVRAEYPDWPEREIRLEATLRILKAHGASERAIRSVQSGARRA